MRNTTLVMLGSLVVFTLFLSAGVFADYHLINESKRNDFNARLQHMNCRVELVKTQLDLLSVANSSISSYKAPLDADYAKLQELAAALNHNEFNSYFTTTFKDDLKNAVKVVQAEKANLRKANLTAEQKKTFGMEIKQPSKLSLIAQAMQTKTGAKLDQDSFKHGSIAGIISSAR